MQDSQETPDFVNEDDNRLAAMKSRLANLNSVKMSVAKLNTVLGNLAVANKNKQLSLLRQARVYLDKVQTTKGQRLKANLTIIANELYSLQEGLLAGSVKPKDLVLISSVRVLKEMNETTKSLAAAIARSEARLGISAEVLDPSTVLLKNNKELSGNIPDLNGKDFAIIRAPVAFTFNKKKHSSVGYVDTDRLRRQGFKVDNLDGYTILHKQMLIGVNSEARFELDDKGEKQVQKVTDRVTKFKGGRPVQVNVKREKTITDLAREILDDLEVKTKTAYSLVSTVPARHGNALWFWAAAAMDIKRLSLAFPGNHMNVNTWGPAFPVEEKAKREVPLDEKGKPIIKKEAR